MHFEKMHGTGNDFVVIDARQTERDWPALAVKMCDRHFGVGADGIILVRPSSRADFRMQMFNPDGSEAEMCGNGIRCFARYVVERGLADAGAEGLVVETGAGVLRLRLERANGAILGVQVSMGRPRLRPEEIPTLIEAPDGLVRAHPLTLADGRTLALTCVSMGNPHAIAFLEEPVGGFPLATVGPSVEHHPLFPKRTNFEIVNVLDRDRLRMRVWERGAGLTLACGTGACAVAVAARLHGFTDEHVEIELPGGPLKVAWDGHHEVLMTGPAEFVFSGQWREKVGSRQ